MNRVRWLNATWPTSLRAIGSKLKEMPFTDEGFDGFAIDRIRDDHIEGRFIEKYAYQETIATQFGREEKVDRTGYRSTEFALFSQSPQIEIKNGQRNIKDFIGRLLESCNFNLSVSPITLNLLDWATAFQNQLDQNILIDSLQISGIEFEGGITGKILIKGNKDVREAVDIIVGEKKYTLDKIQIKIKSSTRRISIHLTKNGSIKIPVDHTHEFLPALRKSLSRAIDENSHLHRKLMANAKT